MRCHLSLPSPLRSLPPTGRPLHNASLVPPLAQSSAQKPTYPPPEFFTPRLAAHWLGSRPAKPSDRPGNCGVGLDWRRSCACRHAEHRVDTRSKNPPCGLSAPPKCDLAVAVEGGVGGGEGRMGDSIRSGAGPPLHRTSPTHPPHSSSQVQPDHITATVEFEPLSAEKKNTMADTAAIEVDPAVLADSNSDYASSGYDTSTASLSSSINEYVFENGRRYHAYFGVDKNPMPTDEKEQDRLDLHHEIMLGLLGGSINLAPVKDPHHILDVGTGTGIWAIDAADKFPSAEVIGTDLSPIQPRWVPPNCRFEVDDAELDWTFKNDYFDYIHVRNLAQSVSKWDKVMGEIFRCTEPGGFVELAELGGEIFCDDDTMAEDNAFRRIVYQLNQVALPSIGRPPATADLIVARLENAGFVDVHVTTKKHPFGPWPKDRRLKHIGAMAMLMSETGVEAYALAALTRILGMDGIEATKLCADAVAAVKNKNTHMYSLFHVAYGRKPGRND